MKFNHLGYVVRDSDRSINAFKIFFPIVLTHKILLSSQQTWITLISNREKTVQVELVEPINKDNMLFQLLEREQKDCIPYHICFYVNNFEETLRNMKINGWLTLTRPFDTYIAGTKASHLFKKETGIVEIIGKYTG